MPEATDGRFRPRLKSESSGYDWWRGMFYTEMSELEVEITFERIADGDNGALWSEARIIAILDGDPQTVIPPSRTNLMNSGKAGSGWKGLAQTLSELATQVRWDEAIGEAVDRAIEVYRNGERETALKSTKLDLGHPYLLEPFIASSGVSVFYGEGGTGKSLIALGLAVSVASGFPIFGHTPHTVGPVVYFDYEDDASVHEERLAAILRGTGAELQHPIYHRPLVAKVSSSQASMRRSIGDTGAVLSVLDSIGMGRGGNANTAEDTVRMFRALRSLGVPTLAIDHVTKEDKREGSTITPYGSVYTINSARLLWGAVVADGPTTDTRKYLNLKNTKANRVAIHDPLGMSIDYHNRIEGKSRWLEEVGFETYDQWWTTQTPDTWELIFAHMVSHPEEPFTINELELLVDASRSAIEKALQRNEKSLVKTKRGRANAYLLADTGATVLPMKEEA